MATAIQKANPLECFVQKREIFSPKDKVSFCFPSLPWSLFLSVSFKKELYKLKPFFQCHHVKKKSYDGMEDLQNK